MTYEEVYRQEYDSAGNYHWWGVHSGHHVIRREETEMQEVDHDIRRKEEGC